MSDLQDEVKAIISDKQMANDLCEIVRISRAAAIEECAKVAEGMAADQQRTNAKYPDHAKAYPTWRNAVHCYNDVARQIRKLTLSSPQRGSSDLTKSITD